MSGRRGEDAVVPVNGFEHEGCSYRGFVVDEVNRAVWFCNKCGGFGPVPADAQVRTPEAFGSDAR